MGGGLFSAINAARTSLEVNQKSIEIVGNNISNVNTEGYSRQTAELSTYPSLNFGDFFVGQGVKISDVQRAHDVFVTEQLTRKIVDLGFHKGQTNSLSEIEGVFSITENNLATKIDQFFDAWQELSTNPSDLVLRDTVLQQGKVLSTTFNNMVEKLQTIQSNINDAIISGVEDINSKLEQIAELNSNIYQIEARGQNANTARDQREAIAQELAEAIGAESYENQNTTLSVQLPGGLPLVTGFDAMTIETETTGLDLKLVLDTGSIHRDIDIKQLGGKIAGQLDIRDRFIPSLLDGLDRLAYELSSQVNYQHAQGIGLDNSTGLTFFSGPAATSTTPGTPPAATYADAARNMSVIITNSNQVAAGLTPDATGDNRNALTIANIGETYLIDGSDDFNSYYGMMTSQAGIRANQNALNLEGAQDAVVQLENLRDGYSGVSLEEEMVDLIVYQRGFESSAKFLSTVDEMMNTLIGLKQ